METNYYQVSLISLLLELLGYSQPKNVVKKLRAKWTIPHFQHSNYF